MIDSKRGLLLVAVLTLVASLVVTFPARVAYHWASPSQIAVSGIKGTVWRGSADAAEAGGIVLLDVSWRFQPLQLFAGRASFKVNGTPPSGFIESGVGIGLGGAVILSDLSAALPLAMFAEAANVRGLRGDASLKFERIKLRDERPVAADGSVEVRGVVAPILGARPIGGFRADVFTQDDGIAASIEDTDAVIDLAGSLQLDNDGSYQLLGQIAEKPETPGPIRQQLRFLGSADERGQREFRIEGSL